LTIFKLKRRKKLESNNFIDSLKKRLVLTAQGVLENHEISWKKAHAAFANQRWEINKLKKN